MSDTEAQISETLDPVVAAIFQIDATVHAIRSSRSNRELSEASFQLTQVKQRLDSVNVVGTQLSRALADNYRCRLMTLRFELHRVRSFLDSEWRRLGSTLQ